MDSLLTPMAVLAALAGGASGAAAEPSGHPVAKVRPGESLIVRARPDGRPIGRIRHRTEFGSPTALTVLGRRGRWLAVSTAKRHDNRASWIPTDGRVAITRVRREIRIDLSRRQLLLVEGGRVLRRMAVGIGRPGSPTPTGRFGVTDRLAGPDFGSYYGCCILALSARQPRTPPGWPGGDRMAIHGASSPGSVGTASSAGCLRARDRDLRHLMREVPLGTPVVIRR